MAKGRDDEQRSRRRRPARGRRRAARVAASIVEGLPSGLLVVQHDRDRGPRVVAANQAAIDMIGLARGELIGRPAGELLATVDDDPDSVVRVLHDVVGHGSPRRLERLTVNSPACEGRVYSLHAFIVATDMIGLSLDDVTERVAANAALHYQALHDALTGLANRSLFSDRLRLAVAEARRTGRSVALLLMDLNQFKEVNDSLGHHHGDRLLIAVANRLRENLRECDTIARLGGDEFAMVLTGGSGAAGGRAAADKVMRCLEQPFEIDGMTLKAHASIGIAVLPEHADDQESLSKRADAAMYTAKRNGGGVAIYDPVHDRANTQRLTLGGELRRAIERGELRLAYQPILEIASRRIARVEALVRWQHPRLGLLPPKEFVDLAELSGVIRPMTRWVLDRALDQAAEWRALGVDLGVSINVSPRNLYDLDLAQQIAEGLAQRDLHASRLTIEIGEEELMDDPRVVFDMVSRLSGIGVNMSIDDFGIGYSSLGTLQDLPIHEIKIDGSLIDRLDGDDAAGRTIVRSIVDLGRDLDIDVVAEGVQSATALARLRVLGCRFAQGYHIGPPMSAGAVALVAAATQEPRSAPAIDIRDER